MATTTAQTLTADERERAALAIWTENQAELRPEYVGHPDPEMAARNYIEDYLDSLEFPIDFLIAELGIPTYDLDEACDYIRAL